MSFPTDTDPDGAPGPPPGANCTCYAAGKTPFTQYASFSGMQIGVAWGPGDDPPENGIFQLFQLTPCTWLGGIGGIVIVFVATNGAISLLSMAVNGVTQFLSIGTPCQFFFDSSRLDAGGNKVFGGNGIVTSLISDVAFSDRDVQNSVVMPPDFRTFFQDFPFNGDFAVHRFSRGSDKSNVHILIDHS